MLLKKISNKFLYLQGIKLLNKIFKMKNNIKIVVLLLCSFCMIADASAQSKKKKPVKKTEQSKNSDVQVFDDGDGSDIFKDSKRKEVNNTLKINPFAAVLGDLPLYYERVLSPKLSVEVGVGASIKSNGAWANLGRDIGFSSIYFGNDIVIDKSRAKPYWSAAVRFFPYSSRTNSPEGLYFSLGTRWRTYAYNTHLRNESAPFPKQVSSVRQFDYARVTVGYTTQYDHFIMDYFAGFGIRNNQTNTFIYDITKNYEVKATTSSYNMPALIIGCRLGFVF
jgi:hypothetical protein